MASSEERSTCGGSSGVRSARGWPGTPADQRSRAGQATPPPATFPTPHPPPCSELYRRSRWRCGQLAEHGVAEQPDVVVVGETIDQPRHKRLRHGERVGGRADSPSEQARVRRWGHSGSPGGGEGEGELACSSRRSADVSRSVSMHSKAALRSSRPSSTVCLNGPRSTCWAAAGRRTTGRGVWAGRRSSSCRGWCSSGSRTSGGRRRGGWRQQPALHTRVRGAWQWRQVLLGVCARAGYGRRESPPGVPNARAGFSFLGERAARLVDELWLLLRLRVEHGQQVDAQGVADGGRPVVGQAVEREQSAAPHLTRQGTREVGRGGRAVRGVRARVSRRAPATMTTPSPQTHTRYGPKHLEVQLLKSPTPDQHPPHSQPPPLGPRPTSPHTAPPPTPAP